MSSWIGSEDHATVLEGVVLEQFLESNGFEDMTPLHAKKEAPVKPESVFLCSLCPKV